MIKARKAKELTMKHSKTLTEEWKASIEEEILSETKRANAHIIKYLDESQVIFLRSNGFVVTLYEESVFNPRYLISWR